MNAGNHDAALLLACAHRELTAQHLDDIAGSLPHVVDWDRLWARACKHGIGYFVASHLRRLGEREPSRFPLPLPQPVDERLREEQRRFAMQALRFLHHQLELTEAFEAGSIPHLWLKGLGLSQQLYGRVEARCSSDLDLLIDPAQHDRVAACLRRCDFEPFHSPIPGKDEHPMGAHHQTWVAHQDGQATVEVHFRLSGPESCQPVVAELLSRARCLEISGQPLRVPALEDELLILCLHAHQHNFLLLRTLMDVAEYVRAFGRQLNWLRLFDLTRACRATGRVHAALLVAQRTLGIDGLPELALTRRQLGVVAALTPETIAGTSGDQNDVRRVQLAFLMDCWSDVGRVLLPHVVPPAAYVRAVCPGALGSVPGVARIYHLTRLAWRALGG